MALSSYSFREELHLHHPFNSTTPRNWHSHSRVRFPSLSYHPSSSSLSDLSPRILSTIFRRPFFDISVIFFELSLIFVLSGGRFLAGNTHWIVGYAIAHRSLIVYHAWVWSGNKAPNNILQLKVESNLILNVSTVE